MLYCFLHATSNAAAAAAALSQTESSSEATQTNAIIAAAQKCDDIRLIVADQNLRSVI